MIKNDRTKTNIPFLEYNINTVLYRCGLFNRGFTMTETQRLKLDLSITAAGITSLALRLYIIITLWEWFVMPVFNVRAITVIELVGLLIAWVVFAKNPSGKMMIRKYIEDKQTPKKEQLHAELTKLLMFSMLFVIGIVYWYFAR
jgi:hypothetical protein